MVPGAHRIPSFGLCALTTLGAQCVCLLCSGVCNPSQLTVNQSACVTDTKTPLGSSLSQNRVVFPTVLQAPQKLSLSPHYFLPPS